MTKRRKLLIITDDSGESLEIYYAQQRFLEAGWQPVIASTQRKLLHGVIHDFEPDWNTYVERPGYRIQSDISFDRVKAREFEAVLLKGGRAPEFLRHVAKVVELVREFHRQGKWIFSICHGIQILTAAGVVQGRSLSAYPAVRPEIEASGGTYVEASATFDNAHVDGNLVTAPAWPAHPAWMRAFLDVLGTPV